MAPARGLQGIEGTGIEGTDGAIITPKSSPAVLMLWWLFRLEDVWSYGEPSLRKTLSRFTRFWPLVGLLP
jgi:hypothetical protein